MVLSTAEQQVEMLQSSGNPVQAAIAGFLCGALLVSVVFCLVCLIYWTWIYKRKRVLFELAARPDVYQRMEELVVLSGSKDVSDLVVKSLSTYDHLFTWVEKNQQGEIILINDGGERTTFSLV